MKAQHEEESTQRSMQMIGKYLFQKQKKREGLSNTLMEILTNETVPMDTYRSDHGNNNW